MSSIVTSLTGGGGAGMAFRPSSANILQPATVDQANAQYGNVNTGLANQQSFLQALQAQNGIGNQQSVFNQLQGVANGTGPNPAQAQLANATGANVANQAAMMAGQRGSSANSGLIARQASMQGGNIQQQAAGQAAALQAQQSLNAMNTMGSLATNQVNQQSNATNAYTNSALNSQANVLGAIGAQNNANVGMVSNQNTTAGRLAEGVAGQQGNMLGSLMGGAGSALNLFSGKGGGGGVDPSTTAANGDFGGPPLTEGTGYLSSADTASTGTNYLGATTDLASMYPSKGGKIQDANTLVRPNETEKFADGGEVEPTNGTTPLQPVDAAPAAPQAGPKSNVGRSFMQQEDALGAPKPQADDGPVAKKAAASGILGLGSMGSMQGFNPGDMMKSAGGMQDTLHNAVVGGDVHPQSDGGGSIGFQGTGAAEGAAKGAQWGSWFGPWGTAIGGAAGALAGGVTYQANGGEVKAMLSPGEVYLPPSKVKAVEKGANPLDVGKKVPGTPKVKGNSYANDVVPATLQSGGVVIPNSITQSKDEASKAAEFVRQIQSNNHKSKKK